MIRIQLDLGALEDLPTARLPLFTDRLLAALPGLATHTCSYGDGVIAGTSAGAAAMSDVMLAKGHDSLSYRLGDLHMAPGLGLVRDAIIDQHFAERGRMGRLIGAVSQNPRVLGIGIDEDTAVVLHRRHFRVIGSGAVYVVDASQVGYSNVAEARPEDTLSIFGLRLHVLSTGCEFDMDTRIPTLG